MSKTTSLKWTWVTLFSPPIIFLILILTFSIYYGATLGNDPAAIEKSVTQNTPIILVIAQLIMLATLWFALRAEKLSWRDIGWQLMPSWRIDLLSGIALGVALGLLYTFLISPLLINLQRIFGDYVPPDSLLPSLGSSLVPFFVANIICAPFIEESLYRGFALTQLSKKFNSAATILIGSAFFGLLHWAGGMWYVIVTGVVVGVPLSILFLRRRSLILPFAVHLALNITEFIFIWLTVIK